MDKIIAVHESHHLKLIEEVSALRAECEILRKERDMWVKSHDSMAEECKKWRRDAQELFNALELAQATIERVNPKVHNSCSGTLDVIKAAITKAEGATP